MCVLPPPPSPLCGVVRQLVGVTPFASHTEDGIIENIASGKVYIPSHLPRNARDFLRATLMFDATVRPDMHALAEHPWVRKH